MPSVPDLRSPCALEPGLERALARVLEQHTAGPDSGVFTDGGCSGNPGPGGWAAVRVEHSQIMERRCGRDPMTTNNRMELTALQQAYQMIGSEEAITIWSDSELSVKTLTEWAPQWAARGWRRKGGEVKNLDLIRPLYELARSRPRAQLRWIRAHDGSRWNEYVDVLATGHLKPLS